MEYLKSAVIKRLFISILLIGILFYPLNFSLATVTSYEDNPDFNPDFLIADEDILDYNSMNIEQIRDFAKVQGGTLGEYIDPEVKMPAYWIIWQAAQEFHVNPRFLLTLLQKEQSLVNDDDPSESQYNWATGYSCYGGICLDAYKGFSRQVRAAAKRFKDYMDDLNVKGKYLANYYCTFTKWCVGLPKMSQDQMMIMPQNKVTAALYTYNPYQGNTVVDGYKIGANYNFWKIWENWFESSVFRPNGSLLKVFGSNTVYLIRNGQKLPFASFSALISRYDPKNIIEVNQEELAGFSEGPIIKFPQYSLLMDEDGNISLLVDEKLRHIASMEVFRTLGFNPEEVIQVNNEDLAELSQGTEITLASGYPTGALIRDKYTSGVYFVQNGIKYPVVSPEILEVNFPNQTVLLGHSEELEKYPKADPIKFKDATLVKAKDDDKVYVISDGKRLHVKDEASFISRGYAWINIIETSSEALNIHQSGQTLEALSTSTPPLEIIEDEVNQLPVDF
ncbi:hypothetical protein KKF32_03115 [Patescibacteria group bacterium]|nr:hypothetical protein [Patescibacteria group bacterium]